jgi:orotidine-5'-phosphate decarboxylase
LAPHAGAAAWGKIGLELFTRCGPDVIQLARDYGFRLFLDLKFHDIPNTAAGAVRSACALGAELVTIHLSGGSGMIRRAVEAAEGTRTLILGVTVLTSSNAETLASAGVAIEPAALVLRLARLGVENGVRGVVCSPMEIAALRREFGPALTIVTPGVRPAGSDAGDQKRVLTPSEAIRAGADHLVIGRPILAAPDPVAAFHAICREIKTVSVP